MLKYTAQLTAGAARSHSPCIRARRALGVRDQLDWTGRLVEAVSGLTLEQYFERNILSPLGLQDTGFRVPADKFDRLVSEYQRQSDGSSDREFRRTLPPPPKFFNGGGGLYSTAGDYIRFMQMILRHGQSSGGQTDPETQDSGNDVRKPDRPIERREDESRPPQYFQRCRLPSRIRRQVRLWFPHQHHRLSRAADRPEAWLGPVLRIPFIGLTRNASSAPFS